MNDIHTRIDGRTGRITLTRPQALNALTHPMCIHAEQALDSWRDDPRVDLVIIDAEGDRAFCAGGDIAEVYRAGISGDPEIGRRFWRDEYRMNAKLARYPKPIVSLMHGFTMGGGVGLGGHVSHRVVCESSQIAMPECGIGFVPDVGGSYLLAKAPGRLGDYLSLTAARMGPGDAIVAGFADLYVPQDRWNDMRQELAESGDIAVLDRYTAPAPDSPLAAARPEIDALFAQENVSDLIAALTSAGSDVAVKALKPIRRNSPLSMAVTWEMLRRLRAQNGNLPAALELEYRVSHRILDLGDFLEGVRAQIIDKDRNPQWKHHAPSAVTEADVAALLAPLGAEALQLEE